MWAEALQRGIGALTLALSFALLLGIGWHYLKRWYWGDDNDLV